MVGIISVLCTFVLIAPAEGFLLVSGSQDRSRCPHNLRRDKYLFSFREKCIQINVGDNEYWDDAEHKCVQRGGHLVEIHNPSKQHFLETALATVGYDDDGLWIGLTDKQEEHTFVWGSGSVLTGNAYSNWNKGEDDTNIFHYPQDCIYLNRGHHYTWFDTTCNTWPTDYDYICEYDKLPVQTTTSTTTTSTTTHKPTTTTTTTTPKLTTTSRSTTKPTTATTTTPKPTTTFTTTSTTTPTTTISTTTIPTTMTTTSCRLVDCHAQCPNGYSGVYVGIDGCVACNCN